MITLFMSYVDLLISGIWRNFPLLPLPHFLQTIGALLLPCQETSTPCSTSSILPSLIPCYLVHLVPSGWAALLFLSTWQIHPCFPCRGICMVGKPHHTKFHALAFVPIGYLDSYHLTQVDLHVSSTGQSAPAHVYPKHLQNSAWHRVCFQKLVLDG